MHVLSFKDARLASLVKRKSRELAHGRPVQIHGLAAVQHQRAEIDLLQRLSPEFGIVGQSLELGSERSWLEHNAVNVNYNEFELEHTVFE
jgi:hypothetical protein